MHKIEEFDKKFQLLVPENMEADQAIALLGSDVSAGFPSPADDHIEKRLDLNSLVIKNPSSTFFLRVKGDSMVDAGIFEGDILVVDKSISPTNGKIIIGILHGEYTVKRILERNGKLFLKAENADYPLIEIDEMMDFKVWGVVSFTIHKL